MNNISETDLAYIAGLIDGEGSISLAKFKPKWLKIWGIVQVANTDRNLMLWLSKVTGEGRVRPTKPRSIKHKIVWVWILSIAPARQLLALCLPYLKIKNKQAELFIRASKDTITSILPEFRALNKRGPRDFIDPGCENKLVCSETRANISNPESAYLCAIIDGEGCFSARYNAKHRYAYLNVTTVDRPLATFLSEIGVGSICVKRSRNPKWRPSFSWSVGKRGLQWLLPQMKDLKTKQRRAEIVSEFNERPNSKLFSELQELNVRGIPV